MHLLRSRHMQAVHTYIIGLFPACCKQPPPKPSQPPSCAQPAALGASAALLTCISIALSAHPAATALLLLLLLLTLCFPTHCHTQWPHRTFLLLFSLYKQNTNLLLFAGSPPPSQAGGKPSERPVIPPVYHCSVKTTLCWVPGVACCPYHLCGCPICKARVLPSCVKLAG